MSQLLLATRIAHLALFDTSSPLCDKVRFRGGKEVRSGCCARLGTVHDSVQVLGSVLLSEQILRPVLFSELDTS